MVTEKVETNLEEYLTESHQKGIGEFTVVILAFKPLQFYIRPTNQNGETLNYEVTGDVTKCVSLRAV